MTLPRGPDWALFPCAITQALVGRLQVAVLSYKKKSPKTVIVWQVGSDTKVTQNSGLLFLFSGPFIKTSG